MSKLSFYVSPEILKMKMILMVENLWEIALRYQISLFAETILCDEDTGLPYGISPSRGTGTFDGAAPDDMAFEENDEWKPEWTFDKPDLSVNTEIHQFGPTPPRGSVSEYLDYTTNSKFQISCYNDIFLAGLDTAGNFQWVYARPGTFQGKDTIGAPASGCVETVPDGMYDGFLSGTRSRDVLSWACIRRVASN